MAKYVAKNNGGDAIDNSQNHVSLVQDAVDENIIALSNINVAKRLCIPSLTVKKGQCIHIIGPNGAGKSTLLWVIGGLIEADSGQIFLYGKAMSDWSLASLATCRTLLAQQTTTSFHLTVQEYLEFYINESAALSIPALLDKALEVSPFLDKVLTRLSGGERQRVEICRALLQIWPQLERGDGIVLLDEPLQGLDIRHQYAVANLMMLLCKKGNAVIMSSHDIGLSANYSDHLWLIHEGTLLAAGESRDVATQTNLETLFECHFAISKHDNFLEIQVCAPISLE